MKRARKENCRNICNAITDQGICKNEMQKTYLPIFVTTAVCEGANEDSEKITRNVDSVGWGDDDDDDDDDDDGDGDDDNDDDGGGGGGDDDDGDNDDHGDGDDDDNDEGDYDKDDDERKKTSCTHSVESAAAARVACRSNVSAQDKNRQGQ